MKFGLVTACSGALVIDALCLANGPAIAQSREGLALVEQHCAICHAVQKSGGSPHPSAPPLRTIGATYNLDEFTDLLQKGIIAGHPDMPSFKFSYSDARAITSYLRSVQD